MERRQSEIPFSRDKRLELIERVRLPVKGYAPTRRKLRALLTILELVTGRDGCFPSQQTLAYRLGTIPRSVKRIVALARDIGLLSTERKVVFGCRRELVYFVHWAKLAAMPQMTDEELAWERFGGEKPEDEANEEWGTNWANRGQIEPNLSPQTEGREEEGFSCLEEIQENLPPPFAPVGTNSPESVPDDWRALEEEVRAFGVDMYEGAVAAAITAGCATSQIRAAIEYAGLDHGWRVPAGALRKKLMSMRPGDEVQRHFPKSSKTRDEAKERRQHEEFTRQRREAIANQIIRQCRREHGADDGAIQRALEAAGLPEHAAHFAPRAQV